MDCRTARQKLSAYIDEALAGPAEERLRDHLASCPECRQELGQLETVLAWVRHLPPIEPSPTFLQQVRERVDQLSRLSALLLAKRITEMVPAQAAAFELGLETGQVCESLVIFPRRWHRMRDSRRRPDL